MFIFDRVMIFFVTDHATFEDLQNRWLCLSYLNFDPPKSQKIFDLGQKNLVKFYNLIISMH